MKRIFSMLLLVVLCSSLYAVGSRDSTQATLNVFAAASLTDALNEIAVLYKRTAPGVTLSFNFQSSGTLQTQIENGAEADLFLSAAQRQMDALAGRYIDDSTRKNLLVNRIVLIVPKGSTKGISSFADCLTTKVSLIALGNSDVPAGQYAEEVFRFMNGWTTVRAKASLGTNVREVLSQVESGSVDCGVVYSTDVLASNSVTIVAEAPAGSHQPIIYPAAVLKGSPNAQAAKAFLDFLSTPRAAAVFQKWGFTLYK